MQKDWYTERLVYRKTGIQAVRHADKQTRKPAEMPTNDQKCRQTTAHRQI